MPESIALSKTLNPDDFWCLPDELKIVDAYFSAERVQHPMRRWEYAMALRAYRTLGVHSQSDQPIYDVGGAGSPFRHMLDDVRVIDPDDPGTPCRLEEFVGWGQLSPAVFCLSVLEHVPDLDRFLYHLSCLVAPGGLLFLTMDTCGCKGHAEDPHHFHWMRERIFTMTSRTQQVVFPLLRRDFTYLGGYDLAYYGDHVYDYTFASLALVRNP